MRRNHAKNTHDKKVLYALGVVFVILLAGLVAMIISYNNKLSISKSNFEVAQMTKAINTIQNTDTEAASSKIGKTVEESKNQNNIIEEVNIINQNENVETTVETNELNTVKEVSNSNIQEMPIESELPEKQIVEDPTFCKPTEGDIIKEYAKENLVYSETLQEWVTHNGIDIKADKASIVKAAEDGTVTAIKNDPRYGITVTIEHVNGYTTRYSNLLTAEFVVVGEKVIKGQTIGTVGNTAAFEIAGEPHLHFELLKDNEYLDPSLYIK